MLNYSGDRVEQKPSLLYTLALAADAGTLRVPLPVAGYSIGVACGVLALLRCHTLCARLGWGRADSVARSRSARCHLPLLVVRGSSRPR